jgi:integrase
VDLDDVDAVKAFVAGKSDDGYKAKLVDCYALYCRFRGLEFQKPRYKRTRKIPFVPLETEIDALIGGLSFKHAAFVRTVKETGARPNEAWAIKWIDVDSRHNTITINKPEKGSNARVVKVSSGLIAMINRLRRTSDYVFRYRNDSRFDNFADKFYRKRKKIAEKMQNPRILKINYRSLRHWKGTMEYHKTKDILHVQKILGHVNIANTLIYTHLINFSNSDEWTCRTAKTIEEAKRLVEAGFEYVTEIDRVKLFRKRK